LGEKRRAKKIILWKGKNGKLQGGKIEQRRETGGK